MVCEPDTSNAMELSSSQRVETPGSQLACTASSLPTLSCSVNRQYEDVGEKERETSKFNVRYRDADSMQSALYRSPAKHRHDETSAESVDNVSSTSAHIDNIGSCSAKKQRRQDCVGCQVCGDTASGFYCGAFVCEACKKFYMRAAKQEKKFVCLRDKQCAITKESRVQCQYCRFKKCISLNMYSPGCGQKTMKEAGIANIPCRVCGAPSSGYHFGALTCEGCKGFFRRMAKERRQDKYVCSKNGVCQVNTLTRNLCKACRYRKCLDCGMSQEASRIGRQPNSVKHAISEELRGCKVDECISTDLISLSASPEVVIKTEADDDFLELQEDISRINNSDKYQCVEIIEPDVSEDCYQELNLTRTPDKVTENSEMAIKCQSSVPLSTSEKLNLLHYLDEKRSSNLQTKSLDNCSKNETNKTSSSLHTHCVDNFSDDSFGNDSSSLQFQNRVDFTVSSVRNHSSSSHMNATSNFSCKLKGKNFYSLWTNTVDKYSSNSDRKDLSGLQTDSMDKYSSDSNIKNVSISQKNSLDNDSSNSNSKNLSSLEANSMDKYSSNSNRKKLSSLQTHSVDKYSSNSERNNLSNLQTNSVDKYSSNSERNNLSSLQTHSVDKYSSNSERNNLSNLQTYSVDKYSSNSERNNLSNLQTYSVDKYSSNSDRKNLSSLQTNSVDKYSSNSDKKNLSSLQTNSVDKYSSNSDRKSLSRFQGNAMDNYSINSKEKCSDQYSSNSDRKNLSRFQGNCVDNYSINPKEKSSASIQSKCADQDMNNMSGERFSGLEIKSPSSGCSSLGVDVKSNHSLSSFERNNSCEFKTSSYANQTSWDSFGKYFPAIPGSQLSVSNTVVMPSDSLKSSGYPLNTSPALSQVYSLLDLQTSCSDQGIDSHRKSVSDYQCCSDQDLFSSSQFGKTVLKVNDIPVKWKFMKYQTRPNLRSLLEGRVEDSAHYLQNAKDKSTKLQIHGHAKLTNASFDKQQYDSSISTLNSERLPSSSIQFVETAQFQSQETDSELKNQKTAGNSSCDKERTEEKFLSFEKLFNHSELIHEEIVKASADVFDIVTIAALPLPSPDDWSLDVLWEFMMCQFHSIVKKIVKFVKKIPGFQGLPLDAQAALLQSSMYSMILISNAATLDNESDLYDFFGISSVRKVMIQQFPMLRILETHISHTGEMNAMMNFDAVEVTYICALLLFSDANSCSIHQDEILKLHEAFSEQLLEYQTKTYPNGGTRYGMLLVRIPELQLASMQHSHAIQNLVAEMKHLKIPLLYKEMFFNKD